MDLRCIRYWEAEKVDLRISRMGPRRVKEDQQLGITRRVGLALVLEYVAHNRQHL